MTVGPGNDRPANRDALKGSEMAVSPTALSRVDVLRLALFPIEVVDSVESIRDHFVRELLGRVRMANQQRRPLRICLPVGPFDYARLAAASNEDGLDWRAVTVYAMDEFCLPDGRPVPPEHAWSLRRHLDETLFNRLSPSLTVPPEQRLSPDPQQIDRYAGSLQETGLDVVYCGFGVDGHVGMNCPEPALTAEEFRALPSRRVRLSPETITQIAMGGAGGDLEAVPPVGVTIGMREILAAGALRLYLMRTWQPAVMRRALFGPVTPRCPASFVQTHPDVRATVVSYVADPPWHETTQRP